MRGTLNRMKQRGQDDRGFTMIELLVVVVIIGILVAIAVPVYLNYRKGAANKSAASDVRGAITAIEQFYTENNNAYPAAAGTTLENTAAGVDLVIGTATEKITVSPGNRIAYKNNTTGTSTSYYICGVNEDGNQAYVYNSANGGSVKKAATTYAACKTNGA
jgi:type IV pilus assembly protein PilA